MKGKKGALQQLQPMITALVAVGVILAVGFLVLAEIKSQAQTVDGVNSTGQDSAGAYTSSAYNATSEVQSAMSDVPGWLSIIVITMIGAFLIGLVSVFKSRR